MTQARVRTRRKDAELWKRRGVGGLWLALCIAGGYLAMRYEFIPGRLGPHQERWPAQARLERHQGVQTTVAFLHPRCVCSKASLHQLIRAFTAHPTGELVVAVFVPAASAQREEWERGAYVQLIRERLSRATIVADPGGVEAVRFGALTSGTMLVYDPQGREVFRGGITERRGGEADNPSFQRFLHVLAGEDRPAEVAPTPVFGCPLVKSDEGEERASL